jgi:hypothetical protein
VIVSATCPLRPLVTVEPAARAVDEGMWRGLLEAAGIAEATCHTHDCLDPDRPCRIIVAFAGRR